MISLFTVSIGESQSTITGKVYDSVDNSELVGVSIIIKNSSPIIGTVSDYDGSYEIKVSPGDSLMYSYIGYAPIIKYVPNVTTWDIYMDQDSETLDEIVVVGYGAVKKEDLTGVVTKVSAEDFNKGVVTSPESLLTGKVAGLQITNNGEPGGGSKIRLRGATSINAGSDPLFVIDGIPVESKGNQSGRNPLNFINPSDIADITVLKDASATAIYGSRGANGVIIVTTKQGSKGLSINYDGFVSLSTIAENPNIFTANQFRQVIDDKAPQNERFLGDASTDWMKEITQSAISQNHNLSFRGKAIDNNLAYYVSLGYQNTDGVIRTSNNENKSLAVNLSTSLFDKSLDISFNTKNGWTNDRFSPGVINAARIYDPSQPIFDEESVYGGYYQWDDPLATNNPVSTLMLTNESGEAFRTLNSLKLTYHLPWVKGLSITTNGGHDMTDGKKNIFRDPTLKDAESYIRNGFLHRETENHQSQLIETYGTYKRDLGFLNSKFSLVLGHSWQETTRDNRWQFENELMAADNEFGYDWSLTPKRDSFIVTNRLISFYGRLNYNIDEKYLFTVSMRRDGSSRFGPENKWGYFPAAAFAWRVLQEDWAQGLSGTLSDLKLRLSYGVTGNENIDDFLYATFYFYGTDDAQYQFGDEYIKTLRGTGVDPNIKWEETKSLNIGVDYGFLDGRISGTLDLYQKNTNDLLFTVAAGAFTNLSDRILTNIGSMENKGIELGLNYVVYDKNKLKWNLRLNAAHNQNQITKLDNNTDQSFDGYETGGISGDVGQTIQVLKTGESLTSFRTYEHLYDGAGNPLDDATDHNGDGRTNLLDIYTDQNGDGIINEKDLTIKHDANPDVILGLTSNTNYKRFDMSFTLRSNIGGSVYNNIASSTGYYEFIYDRVNNNPDPSSYLNNFNKRQLKSDAYIESASFLKLDNISIGYTFGEVPFFDKLRIYGTAQNLLTISGYSGLDPEIALNNDGIDNNLYPISRTFLVGLNASF